MKVIAPGKLILSGEHAVVYGKPALAMAVNRYVTTTIHAHLFPHILFSLSDFTQDEICTEKALHDKKNQLTGKYNRFLKKEINIRDVLEHPSELLQFATSLCLETLNVSLTEGLNIHLQSTIPIGCGMGSSAASILSVLYALIHHLQKELSSDTLLQLGLQSENMQHGVSSGFDLQVSFKGGCVYKNEGILFSRTIPTLPFYLVNTGIPQTSTGECVISAAPYFKNTSIGNDFEEVTNALDHALQKNALDDVIDIIRANHQLLVNIGVVPEKVQSFIADVQKVSSAAKICGAGAVSGNEAGVVLVISEDKEKISALCDRYHYEMLPIEGEQRGLHVV